MGWVVTTAKLYTDGSNIYKNPSPWGGSWAWQLVEDGVVVQADSGLVLPFQDHLGALVTNNQMEYRAVLLALQAMPDGWSGCVCSDSHVTLGRVFGRYGMRGIPLPWHAPLLTARKRLGRLTSQRLDGHPTRAQLASGIGHSGHPVSIHNVACDHACREVAKHVRASLSPVPLGEDYDTRAS